MGPKERRCARKRRTSLQVVWLLACSLMTSGIPSFCWSRDGGSRGLTAQEVRRDIRNPREIVLHPGQNAENFPGIDADGDITVAYMDFGTSGSHVLFVVTAETDDDPATVVPIGPDEQESIDDARMGGESMERAIRFFHCDFENKPATILFISSLDMASYDRANGYDARLSVDILQPTGDGFPPYEFVEISDFKTPEKFFDANVALEKTLDIPLSSR